LYTEKLTLGYCRFISCKMDTENLGLSLSSKFRVLNSGPVCSRILCRPITVSSDATPRSRVVRQGRVPLKKTCQFKFHGKMLEKHLLIL